MHDSYRSLNCDDWSSENRDAGNRSLGDTPYGLGIRGTNLDGSRPPYANARRRRTRRDILQTQCCMVSSSPSLGLVDPRALVMTR